MIVNLTNPKEAPVDGDIIQETEGSFVITRSYGEPIDVILPTHKERFSAIELRDSFTTDEALLALVSPSDAIRAQAQLLMVGRPISYVYDDANYQSMINGLEDGNVLTAERAASYRLGVPKTEGSV